MNTASADIGRRNYLAILMGFFFIPAAHDPHAHNAATFTEIIRAPDPV